MLFEPPADGKRARRRQPVRARLWKPALAVLAGLAAAPLWAARIDVSVHDGAPYHVHPPGQPFSLRVEVAPPGAVTYHWRDGHGTALTPPSPLAPAIASPSGEVGYYGLVLTPVRPGDALPGARPGEAREYGFAILPPPAPAGADPASRFGVVHADPADPYLPVWIKTLTWRTTGARWWAYELDKRLGHGKRELPIVSGGPWDSDDTRALTAAELESLAERVRPYFAASPPGAHWEAGIEENLDADYGAAHYWPNLEARLRTLRGAAREAGNPGIRLIYQIAGVQRRDTQRFARSGAARLVDVLSLHPYAWPDFPAPEEWLAPFIDDTSATLASHALDLPLWFTEVGVPHHGNPGGFFGYPATGARVRGKSPGAAAQYLVKLHVIALQRNVGRLFWYNYRDRAAGREQAENHFGLRDHAGFPRPTYVAHHNLHRRLQGLEARGELDLGGGARAYRFSATGRDVFVVWVYPVAPRALPLLQPGAEIVEVVDSFGTPLASGDDGTLRIGGDALFVVTRPAPQSAGAPAR